MQQLVSLGLWKQIARLGKTGRPRLGAVAYVSDGTRLKFGRGDLLVTDASDSAIAAGDTSAKARRAAFKKGAEIFSVPGLHAKVLVLGKIAVVGSANMSESSASRLVEAAVLTDHPNLVSSVKSLIYQLAEQGREVDADFVARISDIPVARRGRGRGSVRPRHLTLQTPGKRTWIIGVQELRSEAFPEEDAAVEVGNLEARKLRAWRNSRVTWIRWPGYDHFSRTVRSGDMVVQVWTPLGRQGVRVYPPCPVLLVKKESPRLRRLFVEEPARVDAKTVTLKAFREMLSRHGDRRAVGKGSCREVEARLAKILPEVWG